MKLNSKLRNLHATFTELICFVGEVFFLNEPQFEEKLKELFSVIIKKVSINKPSLMTDSILQIGLSFSQQLEGSEKVFKNLVIFT